jgi:nicotinate phosphoribosyltransferase
LNETLRFISSFKISTELATWFAKKINKPDARFIEYLTTLSPKDLKIWAVPEGTFIQPRIPLITIQGPIGMVQFLETTILNMLNYPSLIATNALRFKIAAQGREIIEMGARRAQGDNGAQIGSLYCWVGGCDFSSNMASNYKWGVPTVGTQGHSYVTNHKTYEGVDPELFMHKGLNMLEVALRYRKELDYLSFGKTNDGELSAFLLSAISWGGQTT